MRSTAATGSLIIRVSSAGGAVPIEGATVTVQGTDPENSDVFYSLLTNSDGLTEKILLPTVAKSLSLSPGAEGRPYLTYAIDVLKPNFYPQHYTGVPVFESIIAVQSAGLIPVSELDGAVPGPLPGQVFEEYENPNL